MVVTTQDVITDETVAAQQEASRAKFRQFRQVFREHNGRDANSGSQTLPRPSQENPFEGESVYIEEGAEYPRLSMQQNEGANIVYAKYGFEVPVTDEAVNDSQLDIVADIQANAADEEEQRLDRIAYGILDANNHTGGPVTGEATDDDRIGPDDVTAARKVHLTEQSNMSSLMLLIGPNDLGSLGEYQQYTELGAFNAEQVQQMFNSGLLPQGDLDTGYIGLFGRIPVYMTNTIELAGGDGFLVDTSSYGYHSTREDASVTNYREDGKDQQVYKLRGRDGWAVMDQNAAVHISS